MADLIAEIRAELKAPYWRLGMATTRAAQVAIGVATAVVDQCEAKGQHSYETVSVDWLLETIANQLGIDTSPRWAVTEVAAEDREWLVMVARLVVGERLSAASTIQRRLGLPFSTVQRYLNLMESWGLVGPAYGSQARKVLVPDGQVDDVVAAIRAAGRVEAADG